MSFTMNFSMSFTMKKKLGIVCFASLLLSPLVFAKPMVSALENETCLSINQNISKITQLIDSGELRTDKPFNKSEVPDFSYDSAVPYSAYLAYASKLIAVKKPLAELPCPIVTATSQLLTTQQLLL